MSVYRIYVEKKPEFAVEAQSVLNDLQTALRLSVTGVRILNRYDADHLTEEAFQKAIPTVFSEPAVDVTYDTLPECTGNQRMFAAEYLPGQFDQRADSCEQCIQILLQGERCRVRTAQIYIISGNMTDAEFQQIQSYLINPVERRKASLDKPETLDSNYEIPTEVKTLHGFCDRTKEQLDAFIREYGLAMDLDDIQFCQDYFKNTEHRDPTITEIRMIDTYWSDHCRHTTFSTNIEQVEIGAPYIQKTYDAYLNIRHELGRDAKPITLMDMATLAVKKLKADGKLNDLDESEEINACSVKIKVDVAGREEDWILMFKNETHNHPTEIEPFGGAATCLGGAIRDPLSGRTYVYQAMRVTGAADPTRPMSETLHGKLPQKRIVKDAAHGYSSYGNQIGLATGYVKEIYHPNYVAKRMEIGAVMAAAPRKNVIRETSDPGDVIILMGGRTGRDGIGGATGSSKVHTEESIEVCGAEVQKGNAPTERKLQRLFRRPEVSRLIKKCNDFGAGGVSVAIGELADGLQIDLDKVPKKYAGLDGTEIAISESQERMALVVDPKDVDKMLAYAAEENLEAVPVAVVTESPRLVLNWRGKTIVDLSRAFLDTNGAHQETTVTVEVPTREGNVFDKQEVKDVKEKWLSMLSSLNVCSQKGLVEMFDSTVGASSVFLPYGGVHQMTETQAMVAKLPMSEGKCDTVTMMSYGYDPYLSSWSPYHGATYAVLDSVAKIVANGGDFHKIRFTFQEYFKRMTEDPKRWGTPFSALLGAYSAQLGFGLPSIGGKDSMSGSFYDEEHGEIDVPPTLVSFAVDISDTKHVVSPEFKKAGSKIVLFTIEKDAHDLPVYSQIMDGYEKIYRDMESGKIISAYAVEGAGVAEAVSKMAFGNRLGVKIEHNVDPRDFFAAGWGNIVCEVPDGKVGELSIPYTVIGEVTDKGTFEYGSTMISMEEALKAWTGTLEKVFPTASGAPMKAAEETLYNTDKVYVCKHKVAKPTVFIPAMPGTNCELDSAKAFEAAGAETIVRVFRNQNASDIRSSIEQYKEDIKKSQIIMFPGGFSAGDEPDGSAKFFATVFRNEAMMEEIDKLLHDRDGLVLGICNGFQTLIKLGLLTGGKIEPQKADSPTLTTNNIGRHISRMAYLKVVSNLSPWLRKAELGGVYCNPMSHGEGRFVANEEWLAKLRANGQIAIQYSDPNGNLSVSEEWNPNGSYQCIEGITSPDGRILGKMGHNERCWSDTGMNIYGNQDMQLFASGVEYFK